MKHQVSNPITHGSALDTEICFAVGELERDSLEETAANAKVDFDKHTSGICKTWLDSTRHAIHVTAAAQSLK